MLPVISKFHCMGNTTPCSRKCIKYGYAIFDQDSLDNNLMQ